MSDDKVTDRLQQILDSTLLPLLDQRDGAARLIERLPTVYPPEAFGPDYNAAQEAWHLTGFFYTVRKNILSAKAESFRQACHARR